MPEPKIEPSERHHQAIVGMECRLERDERRGEDISLARIILMRHYAAYARSMVQRNGGSLVEMGTLTDRDNIVPLGGGDGRAYTLD